jgi:AraC-like DNA-binding protein
MPSRLDCIADWRDKAKAAHYHPAALAKMCGVTKRHLRWYFLRKSGVSLRVWLTDERFHLAQSLLSKGAPVKEVSYEVGFKYPENFTRQYKHYFKRNPTDLRRGHRKIL